jgi:hypothetical protein
VLCCAMQGCVQRALCGSAKRLPMCDVCVCASQVWALHPLFSPACVGNLMAAPCAMCLLCFARQQHTHASL